MLIEVRNRQPWTGILILIENYKFYLEYIGSRVYIMISYRFQLWSPILSATLTKLFTFPSVFAMSYCVSRFYLLISVSDSWTTLFSIFCCSSDSMASSCNLLIFSATCLRRSAGLLRIFYLSWCIDRFNCSKSFLKAVCSFSTLLKMICVINLDTSTF